jgi:1,4-alpha-glucan branching enzyme
MVFNFTPVPRGPYRLGVPSAGRYKEVLNTDSTLYGGSGVGNAGGADTLPSPSHGFARSLSLILPPLGCLLLAPERSTPGPGASDAQGRATGHQ